MAIPEKCPKCGRPMVQDQGDDTWFCLDSVQGGKCKYQYHPTRRETIEYLKEAYPDPPPPPGRPVFGVANPADYRPTDWGELVPRWGKFKEA